MHRLFHVKILEEKKHIKGNILVVDDEPDIRLLLKFVLEREAYKVIEAEDGKKAFDLLCEGCEGGIICVITDYLMPRMNGIQLCESIRKERQREVPVFLITAYLDIDTFNELSCFDAKFLKPLDFSALVDELSHFNNPDTDVAT